MHSFGLDYHYPSFRVKKVSFVVIYSYAAASHLCIISSTLFGKMRLNQRLVTHSRLVLLRRHGLNQMIPPRHQNRYSRRFYAQNPGEPNSGLLDDSVSDNGDAKDDKKGDSEVNLKSMAFRMFESAATTFASIAILGCVLLSRFPICCSH